MTLSPDALSSIVEELQPLAGGRIQRIDLCAEREAVIEIRVPGRTLRLLVSARPGLGRVHLVSARPPREIPGGPVQALLRQRLGGQILLGLSSEGRTIHIDTAAARWSVRIDGGRDAFAVTAPIPIPPPVAATVPAAFPRSDEIAARYAARVPQVTADALRRRLLSEVQGERKKLARLERNVARDVERLEAMRAEQKRGELLKTVLGRIPRGAGSVEVMDWEMGTAVEVPLDPALSGKANMERCFVRAKKAARGLPIASARLAKVRARLAALDVERDAIAAASAEGLDEKARRSAAALDGLDAASIERTGGAPDERRRPVDRWARRFASIDGAEILVGRGAKENDRLTFSGSKADDIWLHARGTSGAHVILKNEKGRSPTPEALLDAAHLAAFYSSARTEAKVEVIYTEARHVRKTKGAPPGRVGVAKSKTMLVRIDSARLDRLLGREGH